MSKKGYLLSDRDYPRIQNMLRWYEREHRNLKPHYRRRIVTSAGGGGRWFLLTSVESAPMAGTHMRYDSTDGWVVGGIGEVEIWPHPASFVDNYQESYVRAASSGGVWFATEISNVPHKICDDEPEES